MRYIETSVGSAYIPKLLGIYERELARCVEAIHHRRPDAIIDIGAAEGYYAVGLALRNPKARVIAFEMEDRGREALLEMTTLNEVASRVEIRGKCEPADLKAALANVSRPVVVCDIEGYEQHLIDPLAVSDLLRAAILVEVHEFVVEGITSVLKARFDATHRIEHIWQEPRTQADFPWRTAATRLLPSSYLDWAVSEWRPERMSWLWMAPRD